MASIFIFRLRSVKLVAGTDFTATDGSTVVLTTGAALNDTVDIVGYGTFSVSSAVTLPDGVKASFGNSNDLQIYKGTTHFLVVYKHHAYLAWGAPWDVILEEARNATWVL